MTKKRQVIIYQLDSNNYATYRNQDVTDITAFPDGVAEGTWKGKHVAAFSLLTNEWYRI